MTALYVILAVVLLALAVLVFLWFRQKKKKARAAEEPDAAGAPRGDEIGVLFHEADAKLSSASQAKRARLAELPVYVLLGDSASTKTTVVLHSGLEPELLAGHVYHEGDVVPTRTGNLWFAQGAVFVEAGGTLPAPLWEQLVKRLEPRKAVVRASPQAARAAVVFFDCENFTKPAAQEAASKGARNLRARLGEISQALGINLPVYVLFSKADRLPFFTDYFRNLSQEESAQVLGVTLSLPAGQRTGVYGERETGRLAGEFERLFRSLAEARSEFLARETDPSKLPGAYEFPREFRKIREASVQFLVDLCRPSQLSVGPFLRGFYFTGVRPVVINEAAPVAAAPQSAGLSPADATSFFRAGQGVPSSPAPRQPMVTRRVPQWLFLSHLFHDVLLADRNAMGASTASTKTSFWRRAWLGAAAAVCLLLCLAFTISYVGNRNLESTVREAALGIPAGEPAGGGTASLDQLTRLDTLRQSLEALVMYRRNGAPWRLRWGLYSGDKLYPEARRLYFDRFRQLLFAQTRADVLQFLRGLPQTPGPEYGRTYDALKAYLITTSNPEKSTRQFLSPVLMEWWSAKSSVTPDRSQLARKQFEFYADALLDGNPFSKENESPTIDQARRYLAQFAGTDRVYAFMLAEAAKRNAPVNFNRQFPGTAAIITETHEVSGSFSKSGWNYMKDAIAHADRYFNGEPWVLGDQTTAAIDRAKLEQDLRSRYQADVVKEWRAYIQSAAVVRYAGLKDANQKLTQLSGNQSPLLLLLSVASQNTAVDDPNVAGVFQPVQAVVPPGSADRLIGQSNQPYMNALVTLQSSLDGLANQSGPPNDAAAAPALANAAQAKVVTRQMAQTFRVDAAGRVDAAVQKLLEDPIVYVEGMLRALGPAELNAKGKALCAQFRTVLAKYPFNPAAPAEATLAEVDALFRKPDGSLWTFYDQNLQKLLTRQGQQYAANSAGGATVTPAFLSFFNTAAGFSEGIYKAGAQDPHVQYTLKPESAEGIQSMSVQLDGQSLTYSGKAASKQFTWQGGGAHGAKATVKFGSGPDLAWSNNDGLWAVFRFFGKAERRQPAGAGETLEWVIRIGKDAVTLPSGKPLTVLFTLDMNGSPPVFQRSYFARMACTADVAR